MLPLVHITILNSISSKSPTERQIIKTADTKKRIAERFLNRPKFNFLSDE